MKIGKLLNENRNRLGVFRYENVIKRHFSVPFSEMTTERYWVECLESWWCQWCALLCISFPCWCGCRRTQQKKQVLCHVIYSKKTFWTEQSLSYGFSLEDGRGGKRSWHRLVKPTCSSYTSKSFPSYLQWKSSGAKLANVPMCVSALLFL